MAPSARASSTSSRTSACTRGSMPAVGSSSTSSSGRAMKAPTRPTLRRFPLERPRVWRVGSRLSRSQSVATCCRRRHRGSSPTTGASRPPAADRRAEARRAGSRPAGAAPGRPPEDRRPARGPCRRLVERDPTGCGSSSTSPPRWVRGSRRPCRRAPRSPSPSSAATAPKRFTTPSQLIAAVIAACSTRRYSPAREESA